MKKASVTDLYEVRQLGLVSDVEKLSLIELYQPLIGVNAVGLFNTLLLDPSNFANSISTFEQLSIRTSLTLGEIFNCFEALEAVGLVKTYYKEDKKMNAFIFSIYSPFDPKKFFEDILLTGTLKKQVGKKEFERLLEKYSIKESKNDYEEVSTSFKTYFSPDFSTSEFYNGKTYKAKGETFGKLTTGFDFVAMSKSLSDLGIEINDFSEKEQDFVEKIAALYCMDESQMSAILSLNFDSSKIKGSRLDISKLEADCRKTFGTGYRREKPSLSIKSEVENLVSDNAQLVRLMDSVSPSQFLAIKQNNTKPAVSDLKIVEDLALDLALPFPVINALIDYVLRVNNNMLSKAYVEKIGAALSREGVKTALDTMDYLFRVNKSFKANEKGKKTVLKEETNEEIDNNEEYSDEEIQALIKSVNKK